MSQLKIFSNGKIPDAELTYDERNINRVNRAEIMAIRSFEKWGVNYVRFGFDEKEKRVDSQDWWNIPEVIRNAPDFIVFSRTTCFFEAKGYRGNLKIKIADWESYATWNHMMSLYFLACNFDSYRTYLLHFRDLDMYIKSPFTKKGVYDDNKKPFYIIEENKLKQINMLKC
tara:strand:- start:83 stop:595 length:513 start_codon:yes stop_codon:yes gene_type:complete